MFTLKFEIKNSIKIKKPLEEIKSFIGDLNNWNLWSPWYVLEPECEVNITNPPHQGGHQLTWSGEVVGSGIMKINSVTSDKVQLEVEFLKPWKAKNPVAWDLIKVGEETQMTWTMQATLPVFLFFLKSQMQAWISRDFSRGLNMLKEQLETGRFSAKSEFLGTKQMQGFYYIGIEREVALSDLSTMMSQDFKNLEKKVSEGLLPQPQMMLDFTDKFDPVKGVCKYRACFAYDKKIELKDKSLVSGYINNHKGLCVMHTGPYEHLGNSWSMAMAHQRTKKLKLNKNVGMYEVYRNNPSQVPASDWKTEIVLSLK